MLNLPLGPEQIRGHFTTLEAGLEYAHDDIILGVQKVETLQTALHTADVTF